MKGRFGVAFKSFQQKIAAAVLLLFIITLSVVYYAFLFLESLILLIPISLFAVCMADFVFIIVLRKSVVHKFHLLEKVIDSSLSSDGEKSIVFDSGDEFEELARQLNKMLHTVRERGRVERNNLIEEITLSENQKYLQNVHEGLLFIDYDLIISEYYSLSLAGLFDRQKIAGVHLSDFLYPDKLEGGETREVLEKFIRALFKNPEIYNSIDEHNNPLHNIWISRSDGRRILVDGSFRKIEDRGHLIQIMIIFKDKTDLERLQKKLDEKEMFSNFELDSIVSILRSGPGPYLQYIEESVELLSKFRREIHNIHDEELIQSSFRAINSMKCSASYFDFKTVEKLCHNIEDILSDFREGNFKRKEALNSIVDDIYTQFDHVKHLISRFQDFFSTEEGKIYDTTRNEQEHFFDSLKIMMKRNADSLEKKIDLIFHSDFTEFPLISEIKNPVIHLLLNAVDHGIELPRNRLESGKFEEGKIHLSLLKSEGGGAKIVIEDDGRGLDYERLREIAVEKGFIKKEEKIGHGNLVRALFSSGFSMRNEVNGLSGGGVGLDAVKRELDRIGGSITIKTDHLKGSRFTILLPAELF